MAHQIPRVRTPIQERSQKSLDRMLEAAEHLIRERGFDAVTIGDIVRRAHLGRLVYGRFEDKAALLRAVQDRVLTRVEATFAAQARELAQCPSLAEVVPELVTNYVRPVTHDISLVRAFAVQACVDPVMHAREARMDGIHFKYFSDALRIHRAEIRHADPERAIRFACIAYLAIGTSVGWAAASPTAPFSSAELIEELSRTLLAYFECAGAQVVSRSPTRARRKR